MPEVTNLPPPSVLPAETTVVADRRRPGRRERISPELVPLLRGQAPAPPADDDLVEFGEPDQLDAARGLAAGVLLSAPVWICIAYIGRWLLS